MEMQYITQADGQRMVVIPESQYMRLVEAAEDHADIKAFDAAIADEGETFPSEVVDSLVAGENPVRVYRLYRGMTQIALSKAAGISQSALTQIEHNLTKPRVQIAKKLAEALDVTMDDLIL